jgi:hypothetical protein
VVTVSADGVGDREVTLTGEVTAQGSSPVLECGFAISSVLPLPLYNGAESVWTEGCTGSFSLAVSELTPETRYYFRAYAISDENEPVSYGEVMQFTTLEDTTVYGVFTSPVTDLTTTGATLHGSYTLTTLYLSELSSRGFVYGPSQDPRLGGENVTPVLDVEDETSVENGMMADITGLEPGTAYHVCAFVTISGEITWYSEDRVFTTPTDGETPQPEYGVATNAATGVTTTGATLHGSAGADEPLLVVQRGFVYGTAADPALGHEGVFSAGAGSGAGSFSADVTGLSPGTAYHVRAYASFSNQEILYGEDRTFTTRQDTGGSTPSETSDDAEDEIPPAGKIGYLDMPETDNPWGNVILYTDADGGQFIVGLGIVEGTRMKYISRGPVQYEIIYNAKAFDDIAGHWAEHDIDFNSARLLFLGVSPTLFAPEAAMTRGMFATVIGRMYGADPAEYTGVSFDDVPQNEFYAPYIQWAAENEIVFGVSADKFEPERPVTRQEMAAIMHRFMTFLGLDLESGGAAFDDEAQIAGWARDDVDSMRGTDILNGKPNNLFDPCADSTRAEVAAVFHRLIEYIVNSAS